jgi:hypothetical protein
MVPKKLNRRAAPAHISDLVLFTEPVSAVTKAVAPDGSANQSTVNKTKAVAVAPMGDSVAVVRLESVVGVTSRSAVNCPAVGAFVIVLKPTLVEVYIHNVWVSLPRNTHARYSLSSGAIATKVKLREEDINAVLGTRRLK